MTPSRRWLGRGPGAALLALGIACGAGGASGAPAPVPRDVASEHPDARELVTPYLEAQARGAVGEVTGEALVDARTPANPPEPVSGVSVMLFPRSPALEAGLDAVKDRVRDSTWNFGEAGEKLRGLRADYELALALAGGGELVRGEVSDAKGRFRFSAIPAGRWLVIAWHEVPHVVSGRKLRKEATGTFRGNWERTGYDAVTLWRIEVEVRAAESTAVSLNDRNGWLTVVHEYQRLQSDSPASSSRRRR